MKIKKNDLLFIGAFIGMILLFAGLFVELVRETPSERAERIDRIANTECNTGNQNYDNGCYDYYYSQIEDRD